MPKPESELDKDIPLLEDPNPQFEFTLPTLKTALAKAGSETFTGEDWFAFHEAEQAVLKENRDKIEEAVRSRDHATLREAELAMLQQLTQAQRTKLRNLLCPPKIENTLSLFQIMRHLFLAMLPVGLGLIVGIGLNKTKLFSLSITLLVSISVSLITQHFIAFFRSLSEEFQRNIDRQIMFAQFKTELKTELKAEKNAFQTEQDAKFEGLKTQFESLKAKFKGLSEFVVEELDSIKSPPITSQFVSQNSSGSEMKPSNTLSSNSVRLK